MMKLAPESKLLQLLKQQYQEADSALSPRLARWKYILDCWRGISRSQDYYDSVGYESFYDTLSSDDEELWPYGEDAKLRFRKRELFKHIETFLTRLDKAFSANPRPFNLTPPKISVGPAMPPPMLANRRQVLSGAAQWLCYDYRNSNVAKQQVKVLRDCLLLDVGYTLSRRAEKEGPYPRAQMERLYPWDVLLDPLAQDVASARYAIVRHRFGMSEAAERWPASRDAIKDHGAHMQDQVSALPSTTTAEIGEGRKEILVLHHFGWYDPKALEAALPDDELQDLGPEKVLMEIWTLSDSGPTDEILDAYRLPFGMDEIPIQEYGILADPEERGPYHLSLGNILLDGDEASDILFNRMLESFEYAVLQGGFFDTAYSGSLQEALFKTPKPGEWRGISIPGGDVDKALHALKYPDVSNAYQSMLGAVQMEDARLTSVQDQQAGISTPTQTNTLGEATLLQNEGNEVFRFRAQQLDGCFRRAYRMHTQVAADSLKSWMVEHPNQQLTFLDPETDQYVVVDPTAFDEPWEVELTSGSSLVDGARKAQKLLAYGNLAMQAPPGSPAERVLRQAMVLDQLDPDTVLGPPGQAQAQMMQAMMMQRALGPGAPQPNPVSPVQPGLATDAAMAGQGVLP